MKRKADTCAVGYITASSIYIQGFTPHSHKYLNV